MISSSEKSSRIQNFGRSDKKAYDKNDQKEKSDKNNDENQLEEVFEERTKVIRRVISLSFVNKRNVSNAKPNLICLHLISMISMLWLPPST